MEIVALFRPKYGEKSVLIKIVATKTGVMLNAAIVTD